MYNRNVVVERGDGASLGKFSAALFYSILRTGGGNPQIRNGGVYCGVYPGSAVVSEASKWAALHDPDWTIRREYARSLWDSRPAGIDVIFLG